MDRLTYLDADGNAKLEDISTDDLVMALALTMTVEEINLVADVVDRLAAYEDTGLTPEEIISENARLSRELQAAKANGVIQEHIISSGHNPQDRDTIVRVIMENTALKAENARLRGATYCDSVPCALDGELPKLTNYDRLRAMGVEEMAKDRIRRDHDWCRWVCSDKATYREIGYGLPKEAIQHEIDWLNSPAEGGREDG